MEPMNVTQESSSRFIDNCCRRVKLRTSCLILTYLQLIGNLIKVIFAGIAISDGQEVVNANLDDDIKYRAKVAIILSGLTMTIVVICLLLIILLLVGLHKARRHYVKYFFIPGMVFLVLEIVIKITKFAGGYTEVEKIPFALISIGRTIYFLIMVRRHYIQTGDYSIPMSPASSQQIEPKPHLDARVL